MKINLQKIIVLTVAVTVIISILNISVYASSDAPVYFNPDYLDYIHTSDTMSTRDYELYQHYLIEDYTNGHLTYDQFKTYSEDVTNSYLHYNSENDVPNSLALNASNKFNAVCSKISDAVSKWGDGARERIADWWNSVTNNVPTDTVQTSTSDLDGSGAMVYQYIPNSNGTTSVKRLPCDYIVVRCNSDGDVISYKYCANDGRLLHQYDLKPDGTWFTYSSFRPPSNFLSLASDRTYKFLGDVRYEDGTPAPNDDDYVTSTAKDFGSLTVYDLDKILDDFQTKLENENPELDDIEDILKAIYYKLKQQEDDNISPDELESLINSAINRLIEAQNKKQCDCTKILALLKDMKLCENVQEIRDKLFEIYPDYDFENEVSSIEKLKTKFLAKWSFIEELRTLIQRFMSSYEKKSGLDAENIIHVQYHPAGGGFDNFLLNISGTYDIKFDIFKPYLPTVRSILAAFIYLSYAWNTYRKIPSYIRGGDQT